MSGFAIDGLVIERSGCEFALVNTTGTMPNPASVDPIRREFAKVMGMHPNRVAGPKPRSTGSVALLSATVPEHRKDDAEPTIWEILARKGSQIEPQVTKTSPSNFGSRRRRKLRLRRPRETPLPRLTRSAPSYVH